MLRRPLIESMQKTQSHYSSNLWQPLTWQALVCVAVHRRYVDCRTSLSYDLCPPSLTARARLFEDDPWNSVALVEFDKAGWAGPFPSRPLSDQSLALVAPGSHGKITLLTDTI